MKRLFLLLCAGWAAGVMAAPQFGTPFTDGVVLQRHAKVPVWGNAAPGEEVTVTLGGQSETAEADSAGNWRVDFAPMEANREGLELHAKAESGEAKVYDVLVGEVWLASGQSNMQCFIWNSNPRYRDRKGAMMVQTVNSPDVRFAVQPMAVRTAPDRTLKAEWRRFVPESFRSPGNPKGAEVSAIAFYYALELHRRLGVPVGIVVSAIGGTNIDAWTPQEATAAYPSLKATTEYEVREEKDFVATRDATRVISSACQQPGVLFNGMVAPFAPMAAKGAIWYQGCHNWEEPETYCDKMHALYDGWSTAFENPNLGFRFCQIAPYDRNWAALQEAQAKFAAEEKNAAMAVLSDVGDPKDIHPNDKEIVAKRLALLALRHDYGLKDLVADSPTLRKWTVADGRFVLDFDNVKGWYIHRPERLNAVCGFEVAGADGIFHDAEVEGLGNWKNGHPSETITNAQLVVASREVPDPKHLRYLWKKPWRGFLFSEVDLPLGPFHIGEPLPKVGKSERRLFNDGWTADGVAVTLPHTWNAVDGADGLPPGEKRQGNAAMSENCYARKRVRYVRGLPDPKPGKRYFLRFEGASTKASVWVNHWPIGRHSGAYTAFTFEITEALQAQSNRVEVVVDNRYDPDVPTISADFTVFGGLYRDVWLYETDPVCVDPTRYPRILSANPDSGYTIAEVPMLGTDDLHLERRFPEHDLWSPENPKLYTFDVDLGGDVLKIPFGFRKAEFRADGFYLNGKKRKLRGVNRHQDREGKGWAVSHADEAEDIALIREMGADALRTAHYPQSQNVYDLCDREGLIVWCEAPNTDIVTSSPEFKANLLQQVREMVEQYGNHPSICMWSLFNELHINYLLESKSVEIVEAEKALVNDLDRSRPVVAAGCVRDVRRLNAIPDALAANFYPGWYHDTPAKMSSLVDAWCATNARASLGVSEYGAGGSVNQHQNPIRPMTKPNLTRFHPEECQAEVHAGQYRALKADDRVWGTFAWCMFDFASDSRTEGERCGLNDKGLVTYDRKERKDAFYLYQANWTEKPVLHLVGKRMKTCEADAVTVLAFSNCGEVDLRVNGKSVGKQSPDEICCVRWDGVKLGPGVNAVELRSRDRIERAEWTRPSAGK